MDQEQGYRRHLSTGNKIVVNREFLGLGHTLEHKKRERKMVEQEQKEMTNRLMKLEQTDQKTIKDLQKKYQQLQNIYKIRLRKQTEQENKERLRQQKEDEIKLLKLQWREERERNAAKKKASMDELMEKNRGSYLFEKSSKRAEQLNRNQSLKKTLEENINKTIEVKQNKESGLHRIIEYKRSKNKESIDQYKAKMDLEEEKKFRNAERIKNLAVRHEKKKLELQNSMNSKAQIEDVIRRAHELNLNELERLVVANRPSESRTTNRNKKGSLSRVSSKRSLKSSISGIRTERTPIDLNPELDLDGKTEQKPRTVELHSNQEIEETLKAIEQIEKLEKSTHTAV